MNQTALLAHYVSVCSQQGQYNIFQYVFFFLQYYTICFLWSAALRSLKGTLCVS